MTVGRAFGAGALLLATVLGFGFEPSAVVEIVATNIPYSEARPILESLRKDFVPPELAASADVESAWPGWVARRNAAIRARVMVGDDESVLNLLLFGTTFTKRPRATEREMAQLTGTLSRSELIERRIDDLIAGAALPEGNARLQFVRDIFVRHGIDVTTANGRQAARRHLRDGLDQMSAEIARIDRAVESARALNQPAADLLERSTLFRERGLSTDTSIFSSFAIERALDGIASTATLGPGSVRRVAIVGPGLDFVDKRDGFDFYPPQTIQPFAVIDSLLRFQLASLNELRVTTLDLNPRINDHLAQAVARARSGTAYPIVLARDLGLSWTSRLAGYWDGFGDRIALSAAALATPQTVPQVRTRALRVRPDVTSVLDPRDLNIVAERLELADQERFDLIVATDILVYYSVFEQSLAVANIARMLKPGGLLLSNITLFELPALPIASIGYSDVMYLESPEIGDRLVWYRRK
jgi:hypothetical protein